MRLSKIFVLILLAFAATVKGQTGTSNPFSMFALGEIEQNVFGKTAGLGRIGIGMKEFNHINHLNPAGLSGIDTLVCILDVSVGVKFAGYYASGRSSSSTHFNFKDISLGVRATKWWTFAFGLSPYSQVGYNENVKQMRDGTSTDPLVVNFTGSGGYNRFSWSNSFEFVKGLSLGARASYLFGNTTQTESANSVLSVERNTQMGKFYFDFGLQYTYAGKYNRFTIGGIYGYKTDLNIINSESILAGTSLIRSEKVPASTISLPQFYGGGFTYSRCKKKAEWTISGDYYFAEWSKNSHLRYKTIKYTDQRMYSLALQFVPNARRPETYFDAIKYQIGASWNESYLTVNSYQMQEKSISIGLSLPFRNRSCVNVSCIFGEYGTGKRGSITERYALLSVNLSLVEQWFAKFKWD